MNFRIQSDAPQFARAIATWAAMKKQPLADVIRDEARLLGKRLIDFTPPKKRSEGRARVKEDITRAVQPLDAKFLRGLGNPDVRAGILKKVRQNDREGLEDQFSQFKGGWMKDGKVVAFDPSIHQKARNRRGGVRKRQKVFTTDVAAWRAYVRKIQDRVGQAKGGWAGMVKHFGGKVSAWIAVHAGKVSSVDDRTNEPNPSVSVTNRSAWASGPEKRVEENAVRARTRDIKKKVEIAATKDLAKTLKRAARR